MTAPNPIACSYQVYGQVAARAHYHRYCLGLLTKDLGRCICSIDVTDIVDEIRRHEWTLAQLARLRPAPFGLNDSNLLYPDWEKRDEQ